MSLEDKLYPLLAVYERSPTWFRESIGRAYRTLPETARWGPAYRQFRELTESFEYWDRATVLEYQRSQLEQTLQNAYAHCPFYRERFDQANAAPRSSAPFESLKRLPFLEKRDVIDHLDPLTSRDLPPKKRLYITTGGSTGVPVGFYLEKGVSRPKEQAFLETMWRRVGYHANARVAVIRGHVTDSRASGKICRSDPTRGWLILSSYHLTDQRIPEYLEAIERYRPDFLHIYPSAALTIAEYLEKTEQSWRIPLSGALCGSERLTIPQKRLLETTFSCPVYRWYGHSERATLAGEGRASEYFYFFPQYGFTEFGPPDNEGYQEVIATSFHNRAMPLIRYRTGDYVKLAADDAQLEFPWPAAVEIAGREQEFLVSGTGRRISLTAFNMHDRIFDDLYAVQFFQDTPGIAELRYVPTQRFRETAIGTIKKRALEKLGDDFILNVRRVGETERTARGKHKWLVSELPERL